MLGTDWALLFRGFQGFLEGQLGFMVYVRVEILILLEVQI